MNIDKISTRTGHSLGVTYVSQYWQEKYTVTAVDNERGLVTVYWHTEKRSTTHCTSLGKDKAVDTGHAAQVFAVGPL